jgi:hypothetical protein
MSDRLVVIHRRRSVDGDTLRERIEMTTIAKSVITTAKLSRWFKNAANGPLIANCPPELLQCEFECRVRDCSQGKWLTCNNRIRCMKEEIAF